MSRRAQCGITVSLAALLSSAAVSGSETMGRRFRVIGRDSVQASKARVIGWNSVQTVGVGTDVRVGGWG